MYKRKSYDVKCNNFNSQNEEKSLTVGDSGFCTFNVTPYLGMLYAMLSSCFICLSNVFVKKLTYISAGELAVFRNATVFLFNIPILIWCRKDVRDHKEHRFLIIIRGLLIAMGLYLQMLGYKYLPIAEATTILSILPAAVFVMARFYLKEPFGYVQVFALIMTIAGTLISIKLPKLLINRNLSFDFTYIIGIASSIGGVLLLSFAYVSVRKMKEVHFSILMFHSGWTGALANGILAFFFESYTLPRCGWDTVQTLLVGVLAFFGQIAILLSCQTEIAGIAAIMRSAFEIVAAVIFQIMFFATFPDTYNIVGAILVITALFILTFRTWLLSLPKDASVRRKCKCFTAK